MSLRWEYLYKFFRILLPRNLFNFFPVVHQFYTYIHTHTHTHTYMDSWIFILYFELSSNSVLFCCLNCFCFGHWKSFLSNLGSLMCTQQCSFFCLFDFCFVLPYFLAWWDSPGSFCIFTAKVLASVISLTLGSENQDPSVRCACCCLLSMPADRRYMCVYSPT